MAAQQILVADKNLLYVQSCSLLAFTVRVTVHENHKMQTNIILSVAEEDVYQIREAKHSTFPAH